jgi:hypothetical protein
VKHRDVLDDRDPMGGGVETLEVDIERTTGLVAELGQRP